MVSQAPSPGGISNHPSHDEASTSAHIYVFNRIDLTTHSTTYDIWHRGRPGVQRLQQRTNKTLTTDPFGNTCEADEVSPEVEAGVVARLRCLQP
jgi:hypothetical protein